ncbi:MAG: hypothetical protein BWY52_00720 [Chloroflexi bacterium ADurb.Bin325]|nr:MAG: hypothetical protein BWY52_00720 [Chloroflexi bacterium ADurb.Bin325]
MSQAAPDRTAAAGRLASAIDRLAAGIARHWLAIFNVIVALFVGLPFLAPVLKEAGATGPANLIYGVYALTCHQLPERSFFLFGRDLTYDVPELEALGAFPPGSNIIQHQLLRWQGSAEAGFKVALCQRDVAIYTSMLVGGLLFAALRGRLKRRNGKLPKLPLWLYGVLLLPMLLDGVSQLIGLRESDWPLRLLTGAIFGLATIGLAYPYVEEAMADIIRPANAPPQTGQNPPSAV